ncbi:unnamed protein product [Caenorhabditis nigoni]
MMADEELGDEVKVFRRDEDADDDPMISGETSEQQLADDKKDAVMEAELDGAGRVPLIGGLKAEIKAEPSPSFPMPSMLPCGPYSPFSGLPIMFPMVVPQYLSPNPNINMMNMMTMRAAMAGAPLSPAFPAMFSPNPLFPFPGVVAKQHLENTMPMHMRAGPLSSLNHMKMPPYMPHQMMPQHNERRGHGGGGKVKKEDHIKKPLNAFMWYMKENRPKLLEEVGNDQKQSAELNKELGKRWHDLPKEEQQKYFEMAKKDRESHKEKYPQWSARENYAVNKKKPKRKRDKSVVSGSENNDQKKCRARFGVTNTSMWCKPCQRKKKCIYATDRSGSELNEGHDGRGTSGGCSSSSETPSPNNNQPMPMNAPQTVAAMHAMLMGMQIGQSAHLASSSHSTGSSGTSPPVANPSDSESDVDEDEDIDPTITQQMQEAIMQESICTL